MGLHPSVVLNGASPSRPRDPTRSRRCSGDSDSSSASSAQSCPPHGGGTPRRHRDRSRGGAPQPPRDAAAAGAPCPEERGRSRVPNGPGRPPAPRARSQGSAGASQPLLLISRRRDGQHSWARAEPPGRSRTPGPREGVEGRRAEAAQALERELEELGRRLRAPLRLEPGQEQQLFRRLEEEFLANTRMMEEMEDGETPAAAPPAPAASAAADSAYCSSSSSSSSLNVFGKHGPPAEDGRRSGNGGGGAPLPTAPDGGDAARRPALSSSSDESSCFPASWDAREMRGAPESDTDWAPGEDELTETEEPPEAVPSLPAPAPRPWAKPRLDTQPHKKPSRIPTPRGYGAAPQAPAGGAKPWGALQSVLSSLLEPAWAPREREGLDEDAWP